ncbi:dTDP-4-dehydrorhamnose reductase [Gammaproteobacteria bacterium]|nr:dTDP-4-dehydrorhamnose reductase [Gammaproteobacteria bacterium]
MDKKIKILITGCNGQLGKEIQLVAMRYPCYLFNFKNKSDLDISDMSSVKKTIQDNKPDFIINCAAYTAVDKAESQYEIAEAVNHLAVNNLVNICSQLSIGLIHISTDYVFDGLASRPYKENDSTSPQSVYGSTKLKGEEVLMESNLKNSLIIRTSWVYSRYENNFFSKILELTSRKNSLDIVSDQIGSPTYTKDLAVMLLMIIEKLDLAYPDIFHYSSTGQVSWFDFANEIVRLSGNQCLLNPINTDNYPTAAKRPKFSVLDNTKIKKKFNIEIPNWKESLYNCFLNKEKDKNA